jgi:peptidoglycan hydrolase-like protein with peptidoglycan-binding domain
VYLGTRLGDHVGMNSGPVLREGSRGEDVRRLQRIFVMEKALAFDGIDGVFGPVTRNVVVELQTGAGIAVDGIVGPETWAALPADPDTPELARGSTGAEVEAVQRVLQVFSRDHSSAEPGPADGLFGPRTEAAVRAYQADRGVAVDGIVGDRTWWVPAGAAGATLASLAGLTTR